MKTFLPVSEAARLLDCSTTHVYKLLQQNYLDERRVGSRHFVVASSLNQFLAQYGTNCSISYIQLVNENPELQERTDSAATENNETSHERKGETNENFILEH